MKKYILMIMAFVAMVAFSGCASTTGINGVSKLGNKYTLGKEDNSYMVVMRSPSEDRIRTTSSEADYKRVLYSQLNVAAKESKRMGYNYFVVTNSNINNLNGFPLNRANDLSRFISLKARKPSFATNGAGRKPTSLINTGGMNLRFQPVPDSMVKNGLVSVWSVNQTLRDTN
jgi:hypothetical protein